MEHINDIRKSGIDPSDIDADQYTSVTPHVNKFALALKEFDFYFPAVKAVIDADRHKEIV